MTSLPRYLLPQVRKDLSRKMVFVAGPRQVGKTTLARQVARTGSGYLNWDVTADRERILRGELPAGKLWILDEIHKYRRWRNYLKGVFDGRPRGQKILVTGSGRLDLYRFGGDSLQGRYHLLRLHPLSVAELGLESAADFSRLLTLGGGFQSRIFRGASIRRDVGRGNTEIASYAKMSYRWSASRTSGILNSSCCGCPTSSARRCP